MERSNPVRILRKNKLHLQQNFRANQNRSCLTVDTTHYLVLQFAPTNKMRLKALNFSLFSEETLLSLWLESCARVPNTIRLVGPHAQNLLDWPG